MITRALNEYLMKNNYTLGFDDDSMNPNNYSETNGRRGLNVRTKNRREPVLGFNETLLIELAIITIVVTVVGLVVYFSHRNYKKRSNVHRRRWLESDVTIDNYSDGQIYDTNTNLEENQQGANDHDDSPPSYESVVNQSRVSLKKKKRSKASKNISNGNLSRCDGEFQRNTNSSRNSEPLISAHQPLNSISTIYSEDSSLIDNRHSASTSTTEEEGNRLGNCVKDNSQMDYQEVRKSHLVGTDGGKETNEKLDIVPITIVGHGNEIALLDASGLPTYDTALKIQECGNM